MKRDGARIAEFLRGKAVLIAITVTAVTGGFALGYFVGKSVSSSEPSLFKQSASSDLASLPAAPNSSSEPKNEVPSSAQPEMQPSPPESTQASSPPSPYGSTPLTADARNEEKISPKGQKAATTEKKGYPRNRRTIHSSS